MTDATFRSKARVYKFKHPVYFPYPAIGFAKNQLKRVGVWEGLPKALRCKIKAAGWTGLTITRQDLDSIPDEVWARMANAFNIEWGYEEERVGNLDAVP